MINVAPNPDVPVRVFLGDSTTLVDAGATGADGRFFVGGLGVSIVAREYVVRITMPAGTVLTPGSSNPAR